ncbi:MAG: hypothetical protein RIN55_06110 [Tissierellaceae bacterium]|nr:hypothetical protein [Tissierellaceae bacterium]
MLLNKIIVTNYGENSLSIIDKEDLTQIDTIDLSEVIPGSTGLTRVIREDDNNLLVLNSDEDSLYRVNLDKFILLDQTNLGRSPIRIKTFKDKIYVINIDSNSLSIIDKNDFTIIENIYVGEKPTDLAIDEISGKVYITNLNSYNISVVDYENDTLEEIKLSFMPFRIKVELGVVYILGFLNNHTLSHSIISSLGTGNKQTLWSKTINGIYFDFIKIKDKEIFYLVDSENSWLYEFSKDTESNSKKIFIGGLTNFINYDFNYLYLNDMVNNQIIIVDIKKNQIKKRITVGNEPHDILLT